MKSRWTHWRWFGAKGAVKATARRSRGRDVIERRRHETRRRLKALSAVSLDHSLLRVAPWANPWLLAGVRLARRAALIPITRALAPRPLRPRAAYEGALDHRRQVLAAHLLVEELTKAVGREVDRRGYCAAASNCRIVEIKSRLPKLTSRVSCR